MKNLPLVLDTIEKTRTEVAALKRKGARIGFVPTMGYLHEGHLSLVELAKQHADVVLASIFVNPTQFNNPEDLEKYPRDIPRDLQMLGSVGVHGVFLPTPGLMYSGQHESWVELHKLTADWEGAHRPGHFRGVSTVVSMLFNVVQPDAAVFGEKDFQQLRIIERMVDDLKFPVRIIRGPLVREADGLAMSSRNVRLSPDARARALHISKGLLAAQSAYRSGEAEPTVLRSLVRKFLSGLTGVAVEYIELVHEDNLLRAETAGPGTRIIVAAVVDGVRLIDNIALGELRR